ncbi:Aspartic protease [Grifola frondosa]|uniref:Aspartic protease n=1 Tax=Grifola frondosa TaxID=5627 RepID=A0A1C7MIM8_GRIFR|nr:Aspartic protease [Grifola frondosa]
MSTTEICPSSAIAARLLQNYVPDGRSRSGKTSFSRPVLAATNSSNGDGLDISTVRDLLYIANITIGGTEYPVQLDTGSSDLWVMGASSPIPHANDTATTWNMTYGIGWAYGHFHTLLWNLPEFPFLLKHSSMYLRHLTLLYLTALTAFSVSASHQPNFIAFSLQRSLEPGDDVEGFFSIGEYEPQYAAVMNSSALSTWPVSVPLSTSVNGAPSGKAVVMLDSGTSYTYAPKAVCDALYGNITGAQYSSALGQWIVPCSAEVDMALQFGGSVYPIHPLDVTPASLSDSSTCVGSFIPQTVSVGAGEFDWLIGDNVLRSMYSIYDFGDFDSSGNMGNPYIKLLSLVDPDVASQEFHKIRGGTANTNITYNAAPAASGSLNDSSSTTVSISNELADTITKLQAYFPAMLAIMALNALVILVLAVATILYMCRRRGKAKARRNPGRMSPMAMDRTSSFGMPSGMGPHVYQPVSMALTEDTFVPPTPAFSKPGFDGDLMRGVSGLMLSIILGTFSRFAPML